MVKSYQTVKRKDRGRRKVVKLKGAGPVAQRMKMKEGREKGAGKEHMQMGR